MCDAISVGSMSQAMGSLSNDYATHMATQNVDNTSSVRSHTTEFLIDKILVSNNNDKVDLLDSLANEYTDEEWVDHVTDKIIPSL